MKITIDRKDKDALHKACITLGLDVQFYDKANDLELSAYISDPSGKQLGELVAFYVGATFQTEKTISELI